MQIFKKVLGVVVVFGLMFSLLGSSSVVAATAPVLGTASGYSVFGNAGITETPAQTSHLWGNAGGNGLGHASLIASQVDGTIDAGANASVVSAISFAYGDLADEAQTGAIDLATSPTVAPGVYDVAATAFSSTLTLNGAGVYIFRSTSSIAQTAGGTMLLTNGACASNVFWQIPTSMTFAASGNIAGTIVTNTGLISFVSGVNLEGRAWAATQVTMDNNQITEPTCAGATPTPTPTPGSSSVGSVAQNATLNVVKTVINDNGRTKVVADFPLFVKVVGVIMPVLSGVTNTFSSPSPAYIVSETSDPNYIQTFSGDCDANGLVPHNPGDNKFCIITNNDIGAPVIPPVPPLIDVVKVPSPLALPAGPGPVTYTYTLTNTGTVPVTDITMVGDTCSPINLVSGDSNSDAKLDVSETWIYRCTTTLSETHTNIVTTTGWANGISAVDIASAKVVVGAPIVPPLIHVTKVPSPLALFSAGGVVTYTEKVTNPGTVALSNVNLVDDKCSPLKYISGDVNSNSKLEMTETWTYTCKSNLTQTTTNTVTAEGSANGLTARDIAVATVVVAAPKLPATGITPDVKIPWNIVIPVGILAVLASFYFARKKQITI